MGPNEFESFNKWKVGGGARKGGINDTTYEMAPNSNTPLHSSSLSGSFAQIKDSIARSNAYGAPGSGYQGTFVNVKMAVSREEAEGMASEEEYNENIAETLGEGITRRGGNY